MIDWLTVAIALLIIASLIGFFGYLAWKINMNDDQPIISGDSTTEKKKSQDQSKKKRKEQKKNKSNSKDEDNKAKNKSKETSEETDDEQEESEQDSSLIPTSQSETSSKARKRNKNKPTPAAEVTTAAASRAPPVTHPKPEIQSTKQQNKSQTKPSQNSNKSSSSSTTTKKSTAPVTTSSSTSEQSLEEDQSFTVVGGNRNKTSALQTKTTVSNPVALAQRPPQTSVNNVPVSKTKIADLVKGLPSSQVAVTELMSAIDAFPLSTDELSVIMHKISNKQSVLKQDWTKIPQSQKSNVTTTDESNKGSQDDLKNKRLKELSDELQGEKRRVNDLFKEKTSKEREIEILRAQLDSIQGKQTTVHDQGDQNNLQLRLLNDQVKKLSLDNGNLEKKANRFELLAEEAQKQKDDLIRYNEQLTQSLEKVQKEFDQNGEKLERNHQKQIGELKIRLEQLEKENEQLKREEIVHVEPSTDIQTITLNNEEREELENQIKEFNEKNERLRVEIEELKKTSHHVLVDLLPNEVRHQLSADHQDWNQWISTYRTLLQSHLESVKKTSQDQCAALKDENDRLHQNMTDVKNQLKDIEETVQNKEEFLLNELKTKDTLLDTLRHENEHLHGELQRIRTEIEHVQSAHDTLANEARALKTQLDERFLVAANTPPAVADESFELIKQPSPSLSPIVIDVRGEQLNQLIRTGHEVLQHQDTLTEQLDRHLDQIQHPSSNTEHQS